MSDKAVSPSLFPSLAGWAKALRRRLRSLARAGEGGFTADRLPRAEDLEFDKYAPQPAAAATTWRDNAPISQDHSRKAPSCSNSSIR